MAIAYSTLKNGLISGIDFKTSSVWIYLEATQLTTIATGIAVYVSACFSAERAVSEYLDTILGTEAERIAVMRAIDIKTLYDVALVIAKG